MRSKEKFNIDIPVTGMSGHYLTMDQLMEHSQRYMDNRDYDNARITLEYAVQCAHPEAMRKLAQLLSSNHTLRLDNSHRWQQAEALYHRYLNNQPLTKETLAEISLEQAQLYRTMGRPIAWMAAMLRAKRCGRVVEESQVNQCMKRLQDTDINGLSEQPADCLELGTELAMAGSQKAAELFLREAAAGKDNVIAANACLQLAQLYTDWYPSTAEMREEARKMYCLAREKGGPDFLACPGPKKKEPPVYERASSYRRTGTMW